MSGPGSITVEMEPFTRRSPPSIIKNVGRREKKGFGDVAPFLARVSGVERAEGKAATFVWCRTEPRDGGKGGNERGRGDERGTRA